METEIYLYYFFNFSARCGTPCPGSFTAGKEILFHRTGGSVDPRTGLDECDKSNPLLGFDTWIVQLVARRYAD